MAKRYSVDEALEIFDQLPDLSSDDEPSSSSELEEGDITTNCYDYDSFVREHNGFVHLGEPASRNSVFQTNEDISSTDKIEEITGRRVVSGKEEYLVHWKGYERSSATWEPLGNLTSCKEVLRRFLSKVEPIPGANPHQVSEVKKKTVHVKMLLTRKGKYRRSSTKTELEGLSTPEHEPKRPKRGGLSESERLIRDTLIHESKTMDPVKAPLDYNCVNGLLGYSPIKDERSTSANGFHSEIQFSPKSRKHSAEYLNGTTKHEYDLPNRTLHNGQMHAAPSFTRLSKQCLDKDGDFTEVLCTKEKRYMKITLNNDIRHNLLNLRMIESLAVYFSKAQKDPSISAVLLTNSGEYFCSGIDYGDLLHCDDKTYKSKAIELAAALKQLVDVLIHFSKPIVTAVCGACIEFGVSLVVLSDFAFATHKSSFELTFSRLGLTPIGCLTYLLPRTVGSCMASDMLMMGECYKATFAYDRGLLLDLYGFKSFEEDIQKKVLKLVTSPLEALEHIKRMTKQRELPTLQEVSDSEIKTYLSCLLKENCRNRLSQDWTVAVDLYSDNL